MSDPPQRLGSQGANAGTGSPAADVHNLVDAPRGADGLLQIPGAGGKQFRRGTLAAALE